MEREIIEQINKYKEKIKHLMPEIREKQLNYIVFLLFAIDHFRTMKSAHFFLKNYLSLPSYDTTIKQLNKLEPILSELVFETINLSLKEALDKIEKEFNGDLIFFDRQFPNRGKIIKKKK